MSLVYLVMNQYKHLFFQRIYQDKISYLYPQGNIFELISSHQLLFFINMFVSLYLLKFVSFFEVILISSYYYI